MDQPNMRQNWVTLSREEKRKARLENWLSAETAKIASAEARRAFQQREKRIEDITQLRVPDRVPIWFNDIGFFPARYTGISFEKMFYDSQALAACFKKTILDFEPDVYWPPTIGFPGEVLEIFGSRTSKWPGHGLPSDCGTQYVEGEYLKADEYDNFINNTTDFMLRAFLPRTLGALEPLRTLPDFRCFNRGERVVSEFLRPDIIAAFNTVVKAEPLIRRHKAALESLKNELREQGFPIMSAVFSSSPFDHISDSFRGMRGIMLDMYRQPEKLLEAMDRLVPKMIESYIADANKTGSPRVMSVVHRGSDNFMSVKQWEEFYWPGFKKILLALIDEGLTPVIFLEGDVTSRLQYFLELPRGKAIALIDSTDMFKAKEIVGRNMCLAGNLPPLLLQNGTPDQVKEYSKKLIDGVGRDGGFMMAPRSSMDYADPALVKVWFDFTKEYGVYR